MRTVALPVSSLLMLLACGTAAAASGTTYRWVDKDGVVHYSDRPAPGAKEVELPRAPLPGTVAPTPVATGITPSQPPAPFRYQSCTVASPLPDQVYNNTQSVSATVALEPGLRPGDRIQILLDGRAVEGWPPTSTSFIINNLFRGTHFLSVVVLDPDSRSVCMGPQVTFHVTQPSLLAPGRR